MCTRNVLTLKASKISYVEHSLIKSLNACSTSRYNNDTLIECCPRWVRLQWPLVPIAYKQQAQYNYKHDGVVTQIPNHVCLGVGPP